MYVCVCVCARACWGNMVINLRGQLDCATRLTGQTLFWVFLQGYFWMRLTFTPVDRVKQIALMSVGLTQSVEGLESPKGLILLQEKKNFSCWLPLNWDIGLFLPSDSNWNISFSWVSSLPAFGWELHHWLPWVSSSPTHPADLGTCEPP